MVTFFQAVFGGLAQGCVYALIALGYSVIYSTLKMGHFAQGEFYMVGAFVGLTLFTRMKLPVVIAFAGAALFTSILMLVLERLAYRPLYNRPSMSLLMATLGMQYVVQEIVRDIWGSDVVRSDNIFPQKNFSIGGLVITAQNLLIILICAVLMIALTVFMKYSKTGRAMTAVSMNRKAASLMGVRTPTIIMATYVIAACLAAVAGVMMGPIYSVKYSMGTTFGNKAMTAAVMGGFGSLPGAMLGSVLLGIVESLCSLYISTAYKDVFSFVILVIVLFYRPQGILGKKSITKV